MVLRAEVAGEAGAGFAGAPLLPHEAGGMRASGRMPHTIRMNPRMLLSILILGWAAWIGLGESSAWIYHHCPGKHHCFGGVELVPSDPPVAGHSSGGPLQ